MHVQLNPDSQTAKRVYNHFAAVKQSKFNIQYALIMTAL